MFSATGNLLSGSPDRPDIYTISVKDSTRSHLESRTCTLNKLGYCPGIGTITGCGRTLLGIVHSIVHLTSAIFDSKNRAKHLKEAKLGSKNIVRGLVEMIPVIGTYTMVFVDLIRMEIFENQAKKLMKQNPNEYSNHITLFIYGKETAKLSIAEANEKLKELAKTKKPSRLLKYFSQDVLSDLINIMQNKA